MSHWVSGHRPLVNYYSRGWGPWAVKTANLNDTSGPKVYEAGGSRLMLRFNFMAIPTGTFSSCDIFLRTWNPSFMYTTPTEIGGVAIRYSYAPSVAYGGSSEVRFHFDNQPQAPSAFEAQGYGSLDLPAVANEGKGSGQGDGSLQFANLYDLWGTHLTSASSSVGWARQRTAIYIKGKTASGGTRDTSQYYYDYKLQGAIRDSLVECIKKGPVLMTVGFNIGNALAPDATHGMHAQCTLTSYISRFEFVIRATGARLNY